MSLDVAPFVGGKIELDEEIKKKQDANPELYLHEFRLGVERLVVERVNGDTHHQKDRQKEDDDMQKSVDSSFPEYKV